jgi:hypothetical protein
MELTTCQHCGVAAGTSAEGYCLNCRQPVVRVPNPFADNPYESPGEGNTPRTDGDGMTIGEKIYSAIVIFCTGFFLVSLGSFHFIVIPAVDEPEVLYFVASLIWMYVAALTVTIIINLYYRSLVTIPTIVQCAVLGLALYFLPIAVWGGVLLYRRLQRAKGAG